MENNNPSLKSALNLLKRRWYTVHGLRQKLELKKFLPDEIDQTIAFLIDKKMLDDIRFAKYWIKDRLNFRPKSKYLINQELLQKGIAKDDIELAWVDYENENGLDEEKIVLELAIKKIKITKNLTPEKQKIRLISYLMRKGFSYDLIKKALAKLDQ